MYVQTLRGEELWYDHRNSEAESCAQEYLKFEKNFERHKKTLPVYHTVCMTLATMFSGFMWYASENWAFGLFVFGILWLAITSFFGPAKRAMKTFTPIVAFAELRALGVIDTKNDHAFVLLNQVLAKRNPAHTSLDDYDPRLVSEVVPGYLQAVPAIASVHRWWPEELPNTHVLAQEAASRLVREAG